MNENEIHIVDLIERYLKDELSDTEKQELDSWKHQSTGNLRIFEHLTSGKNLKESIIESYSVERKERLLAGIHKMIEADQKEAAKVVFFKSVTIKRFMSAAAIIALIVTITYFWLNNNSEAPAVAQKETQPTVIDNGHSTDGAILKLANGKEIVLDNLADGNVAEQGNASIVKQEGNVLVYNSDAPGTEILYNTLSTPVGRQFQIVLPDGSRVWLNSSSTITYPTSFTGANRDVTVSGEVYMEVARDARRPFRAHVTSTIEGMGETVVQVLGTHFNINAYGDETPVLATLLEGSVKVITGKKAALLKPGEQARVETKKISVQSGVDLDKEVAWKNGYFEFRDDPLQTVMKELARWYGVTVSYAPAFSIPDDTFNGRIPRSSHLTDVLNVLEKNEVHFKIEGKKIIVSP